MCKEWKYMLRKLAEKYGSESDEFQLMFHMFQVYQPTDWNLKCARINYKALMQKPLNK